MVPFWPPTSLWPLKPALHLPLQGHRPIRTRRRNVEPASRAIELRNDGQPKTPLCDIRAVRHPLVLTMDDDFRIRPRRSIGCWGSSTAATTLVYGSSQKESRGMLRDLVSQVTKMLILFLLPLNAVETSHHLLWRKGKLNLRRLGLREARVI